MLGPPHHGLQTLQLSKLRGLLPEALCTPLHGSVGPSLELLRNMRRVLRSWRGLRVRILASGNAHINLSTGSGSRTNPGGACTVVFK